jgi:YidC/Oxa1 family membrane protein insertase
MVDFLENLFYPVTSILGSVLLFFYGHGAPWWLSIALLTIVVRTLLFLLTIKQIKSMRAMQDLKPELDRIRNKYKDNRQKQQEEQMKLFQERKINPLGGCLPLLVQAPVFIGIFYVIREFGGSAGIIGGGEAEGTQPSFKEGGILWFTDLTAHDPYFVLPILSALTLLLSMEITNKSMLPQQRWLMRVLPFGVTFFTWTFPAGLFVYWITSNLVTLVQNYLIYNFGPGRDFSPSSSPGSSAPDAEIGESPGKGASRPAKSEEGLAKETPSREGKKTGRRKKRNRRKR